MEEDLNLSEVFFTCERFRCKMRKAVCVDRQNKHSSGMYFGSPYEECRDCEQGKVIAEEIIMERITVSHNVPEPKKQTETKEKVCIKCKNTKPIDEFARSAKSKDGRMHICRECHGRAIHYARNSDHPIIGTERKERIQDQNDLTLDFSEYPEVLDKLRDAARINIRPIEHQALYYIIKALKEDEK